MNFPARFDPPAFVREIEDAALDGDWTIRQLSPALASPRPWFHRAAKTGPGTPTVYLSAGIHGDEISGPFALLEMLRRPDFFRDFEVTIFPILNPDGLLKESRENAAGIDLNRDYREPKSSEIAGHIEALKTLGRFDGAMMMHEDYEGIGAYVFELNDEEPPRLGAKIIAAMGRHVPIDLRPEIDELPAHDGVISRGEIVKIRGPIEDRPDWPEAVYLSQNHTQISFTTETPKPFPLVDRVAAQIAAVETLLEALKK
jgi:protein MpaA